MSGQRITTDRARATRPRGIGLLVAVLALAAVAVAPIASGSGPPAAQDPGSGGAAGVTAAAIEIGPGSEEPPATPPEPAPAPETVTAAAAVTAPAAGPAVEDSRAIPASVGRQGAGGFRVSLAGVPAGVPADRLVAVAARSGRRWGLTFLGTTRAAPVSGDGVNVVGFGTPTIAGAGAETTSAPRRATTRTRRCARERVVRRVKVGRAGAARTVRRVRSVRRCRMVASSRIRVEEDIVLSSAMAWQAGPAYPTAWQVDLETVLLHELGHVAGRGHVEGCSSTPMWTSLAQGDWWRGIDDWHRAGC